MFDLDSSLRDLGHQYELETRRIRVAVRPAYLDDQSDPDDDRYVWSYTVTIENRGQEPVQLMSRYWNIVDGVGRTQEISGPGVVGAQPVRSENRLLHAAGSRAAGLLAVGSALKLGKGRNCKGEQNDCRRQIDLHILLLNFLCCSATAISMGTG
jgi:hypothetical protein